MQSNQNSVLKCVYANVDGIMNKKEEFKFLLDEVNPPLVFLVETKLNAEIANLEIFDVNSYEVYRKDRIEQSAPGGGVSF